MPELPNEPEVEGPHLLYVADPLCSWCYGFAPTMEHISHHFKARMGLRLIMGGLRAGNTQPMRPEDKAYIQDAWTRVAAASGQPFDHAFFDREGFVYDTEPACRAVVTVREWGEGAALSPLAFKSRISEAFYRFNRDVTDPVVITAIAAEAGFDPGMFKTRFLSEPIRNATFRDFLMSQEMGVRGFPMLAAGTVDTGYTLVTNGFRPIDGLVDALEAWLAQRTPIAKSG
jgi:putative protein-disulfide isomerase